MPMANGRTFRLNNSAKKFASPSEGAAEGGGGGNSAAPPRKQNRRPPPPPCSLRAEASKKVFFSFSLPAEASAQAGLQTLRPPAFVKTTVDRRPGLRPFKILQGRQGKKLMESNIPTFCRMLECCKINLWSK